MPEYTAGLLPLVSERLIEAAIPAAEMQFSRRNLETLPRARERDAADHLHRKLTLGEIHHQRAIRYPRRCASASRLQIKGRAPARLAAASVVRSCQVR